jgi:hypothetical protein
LIKSGLSKAKANQLAATDAITPESDAVWQTANAEREDPPTLREALSEFHQLTGGSVTNLKGFIRAGDRAYAMADGTINLGSDPQELLLFHEMAHLLEDGNPEIAQAARSWRDSRATGAAKSLRSITGDNGYNPEEIAIPDDFVSPYAGKVYASGSTEIISMGLEFFGSNRGVQRLLERDPEHFYLMLGVIDKARSEGSKAQNQASALSANDPRYSGLQDVFSGGYRQLTPVEEAMLRSQQKRKNEYEAYLQREKESIRRRTSGEIDRKLREYYDTEARQIRKRLGIPEPQETAKQTAQDKTTDGKLQIKSYTRELEPVQVLGLDGIDEEKLNPTQKTALRVARDYQSVQQEINEAIARIPSDSKTLPADAYQRIYAKTNQLFDRLTGLINESKALTGKTGRDDLERYIGAIAKISKENLPGYEIRPATKELIDKAAKRPC